MKKKEIVIIGAGGFGREVLWLIRQHNDFLSSAQQISNNQAFDIIGFLDANSEIHGKSVCGVSVLGSDDWIIKHPDVYAICALGNPRARIRVVTLLEKMGVKFTTVIHPSVVMSEFVEIGIGSIICAGVILTTQIKIGNHVIINLHATVGHDVIIGDFVTIAPAVNISGNVEIGYGAEFGTNSVVIPNLKVGKGSIIGAGAVVNKDVAENTVAVGIPAKSIKTVTEPL